MAKRRVRRTESQWSEIIEQFGRSGLTTSAFCAERGLAKATFLRWRQRLADRPMAHRTFVPLTPPVADQRTQPLTTWSLELDLGDGMTLRLQRG